MKRPLLALKKSLVLAGALSLLAVATPALSATESAVPTLLAQSESGWFWNMLRHWFGRIEDETGDGTSGSRAINDGNPVPAISDDDSSADFLKERIAEEALTDHGSNYAQALQNYGAYSDGLAKTLSQLTPEEQQAIFYGN